MQWQKFWFQTLFLSGFSLHIAFDAPALAQTPRLCPAQLDRAIATITNRPEFQRARWGILVQTLGPAASRQTLYAQDAQRYFTPASTVKLMTTAAALQQLGPDFRIRTSVYQEPDPAQTVLRVVGRGDPSLDDADLAALAQQIRDRGIPQIDRLLGDDTYFAGAAVHPNWEWEDIQAGYGAPVNSLMLNQNEIVFDLFPQAVGQPLRVQWRDPRQANLWQIENRSVTVSTTAPEFVEVGRDLSQPILRVAGQLRAGAPSEDASVSVPDPTRNFLQQFQSAIAAQQIPVAQALPAIQPLPSTASEIAFVASPPLLALINETNQDSNNLYAEALLKQLGTQAAVAETDTTTAGLEVLQETLGAIGVQPDSYQLADGSGLSRHNLVSPEALVQTLQGMAQTPQANTYRASLAIAGTSGTLQNRFLGTSIAGQLWGKTGTLSDNAALAGYLNPPNYSPLAFSVLVNQTNLSGSEMRRGIDEIVLLLSQLQDCGT